MRIHCMVAVLAAALLNGLPAYADNHDEDTYDEGTVWDISWIETHPTHFDDYMDDLHAGWRRSLEIQKADGRVLDYRVLTVVSPRDGEPNLMLMIEYPNMAALDAGREYFRSVTNRVFGSMQATQDAGRKRGEIRTLRGGLLTRELVFRD